MKLYIRQIDSCLDCGHSRGANFCAFKEKIIPDNMIIPSWCPLEDVKNPNQWHSFREEDDYD